MIALLGGCGAIGDTASTGDTALTSPPASYVDVAEDIGVGDIDLGSPGEAYGYNGAGLAPLVLDDLDGDGDPDLLAGNFGTSPSLYLNLGDRFEEGEPLPPCPEAGSLPTSPLALIAADLDGDAIVDVAGLGPASVVMWRGLGEGRFDAAEVAWVDEGFPPALRFSFAAGDLDGDGDVDLALPGYGYPDAEAGTGAPFLWLESPFPASRAWTAAEMLAPATLFVLRLTDRDADGDLDILAPPDRAAQIQFWRNDRGSFEDDAAAIGAMHALSGMGITALELGDDGQLDYCLTDVGDPLCLVSTGDGIYAEASAALGIYPREPAVEGTSTIGWAIEAVDLDNDGDDDLLQASGPHTEIAPGDPEIWPDLAFLREGDGFEERGEALGLASRHHHAGLRAADLDGDGTVEVVVTGYDEPPHVYRRETSENNWLAVDLVGKAPNTSAIGARVEIVTPSATIIRELVALTGPMQGARRVHVGLGDADEASVRVLWPGGEWSDSTAAPANVVLTMTQPDPN